MYSHISCYSTFSLIYSRGWLQCVFVCVCVERERERDCLVQMSVRGQVPAVCVLWDSANHPQQSGLTHENSDHTRNHLTSGTQHYWISIAPICEDTPCPARLHINSSTSSRPFVVDMSSCAGHISS